MRLLDTFYKRFLDETIYDPAAISYAILSHTWEDGEVGFQDMANGDLVRQKKGWQKIAETCEKACSDKLEYAWVDTCCIDKSSSAELSEAINSMYYWYQQASVCYVYLSDYTMDVFQEEHFSQCRWLKRGWTLQELVAPREVYFYNKSWEPIGSKSDFCSAIARVTQIPEDVLAHRKKPSTYSVAARMSWAAYRETTRVEDIAYSLLGIFDINMPLLYGEREKAFIRLQEEIIKQQLDLSILAWDPRGLIEPGQFCGALAPSPRGFKSCGLTLRRSSGFCLSTSKGLQLNTALFAARNRLPGQDQEIVWYSIRVGRDDRDDVRNEVIIRLQLLDGGLWARDERYAPESLPWPGGKYKGFLKVSSTESFFLATKPEHLHSDVSYRVFNFNLGPTLFVRDSTPRAFWDDNNNRFLIPTQYTIDSLCMLELLAILPKGNLRFCALVSFRRDPPAILLFECQKYPAQTRILQTEERPTWVTLFIRFPELRGLSDVVTLRSDGIPYCISATSSAMGTAANGRKQWTIDVCMAVSESNKQARRQRRAEQKQKAMTAGGPPESFGERSQGDLL
jgi:hypothetical protein